MRPKLQVTLRALVNIIQYPSMKGYYILYNSHHYVVRLTQLDETMSAQDLATHTFYTIYPIQASTTANQF